MSREVSAAGTSLWAAPERAYLEDQTGKGHWEFSGYFPNLMGRLGPWEEPVTPSWVPDPEGPLLHHEVVNRLNGAGGAGEGQHEMVPERREEGPHSPHPPNTYTGSHTCTHPLTPDTDAHKTDTYHTTHTYLYTYT